MRRVTTDIRTEVDRMLRCGEKFQIRAMRVVYREQGAVSMTKSGDLWGIRLIYMLNPIRKVREFFLIFIQNLAY